MLITLKEAIEKIEKDNDYILSEKEIENLDTLLQISNNNYWQALGITPIPSLRAIRNLHWPIYYDGFINRKCAKQFRKVKCCHDCLHFLECLNAGQSLILNEKGEKR